MFHLIIILTTLYSHHDKFLVIIVVQNFYLFIYYLLKILYINFILLYNVCHLGLVPTSTPNKTQHNAKNTVI